MIKVIVMKLIDICILDDENEIDIENDNVDVCVNTDDEYTYTLSFATPKHLQFLIDKDKLDYSRPGYPFIVVNKLTPEIIEQAVKAFIEEDGGYWLKVYHFAGSIGIIDESTFDQLKAKRIERREELDRLDNLISYSDELELDELLDELDGLLDEFND
jgi:hypothetical protein